jgi:peptidyl-prolyl cis-trans isomerase C
MQIANAVFDNRRAAWMRRAVLSFVGAIAVASFAVPASAQAVLGSGNGVNVTDVDMRAAGELIPLSARAGVLSRKENVEQQAKGLYLRRILAAEALKDGVDKDPVVAAVLQLSRERILSDALLAAQDKAATPSDAVQEQYAQAAYKADPKRFEQPALTRAKHILVRNTGPQAKAKAEELLAKIKAGTSFDDVARAESDDIETSASGGDLGFFPAGKMVKEFDDALAGLKNPGDVGGPVLTEFGWHLIKLEERRPAGILPYVDAREALRAEVRNRAYRDAREEKVNKLLGQFKADPAAIEAFAQQYAK